MANAAVKVINLGKRAFTDALKTQELCRQSMIQRNLLLRNNREGLQSQANALLAKNHSLLSLQGQSGVVNDDREYGGILLLVEHWPVFTAGLRDTAFNEKDERRLLATGAQVHRTNRGGLATFHGPGQLVAYPIMNLKNYSLGLQGYVKKLEDTLVDTCIDFGINVRTTDDVGVWVEDRKIASIGVNAKRYVTLHGVALNCSTELSWFDHITPCGLEGTKMTSLSKESGTHIGVSEVTATFLQSFAEQFDCELFSESDYVCAVLSAEPLAQSQFNEARV